MTIREKLQIGVGVLGATSLLLTILALVELRSRVVVDRATDEAFILLEHHAALERATAQMASSQKAYLATGDIRYIGDDERAREEYQRYERSYAQGLASDERQRFAEIERLVEEWRTQIFRPAMEARIRSEDVTDAQRAIDERSSSVRSAFEASRARLTTSISRRREEAARRTRIRVGLVALLGVGAIGFLAFGWREARLSIIGSLGSLVEWTRQLGDGDLQARPPRFNRDEISAAAVQVARVVDVVLRREAEAKAALAQQRMHGKDQTQARARAEAQANEMMTAFRQIPAALIVFEAPSGRVTQQNAAADALFGRVPADVAELLRRRRSFVFRTMAGKRRRLRDLPHLRALAGETIAGVVLKHRGVGGREVTLVASAAPVLDQDGKITGAVAAVLPVA
jgi:CHASE3 domain sensor protein